MIILEKKTTCKKILDELADRDGFIKGVVDINQKIVALDAEMHYMLSDYLKVKKCSKEIDMWGFNLWLCEEKAEDMLEFDSFINIRNNQAHGFMRGSMNIEDNKTKQLAKETIKQWIQF